MESGPTKTTIALKFFKLSSESFKRVIKIFKQSATLYETELIAWQ